ncbi:SGNH/GDSL hydrolase family protein [Methylocucumis oryzae]|uniref:GDSL family lipase n=1 Tax=Methylocucumis oryzae TaxID=1632867 RepID=A0A0F3IEH5_9GAMM|nr:SGNH/GDSL hydrolase family protein [Methylocucumis oryzae]KJV05062.1 hypothetical protein VZ94_20915 [Methylocucumis oryzae]
MLINYAVKLCLLLLTLNAINVKAADFDNLIVFGDSLSDNGNVASITTYDFLNHPPYQQGFSNGQLAVERLATLLGLPLKPAFFSLGKYWALISLLVAPKPVAIVLLIYQGKSMLTYKVKPDKRPPVIYT